MQTGDKDGDGNGDNKCVAEFGTAMGDKKFMPSWRQPVTATKETYK